MEDKKLNVYNSPYNKYFKELGRWNSPDTGQMILFEVYEVNAES